MSELVWLLQAGASVATTMLIVWAACKFIERGPRRLPGFDD